MEGMHRMARVFVESPETILKSLVDAAIEVCGADSAGISMEREGGTDQDYYQWVATAGTYSGFLHARLPRIPSACGICLERGEPQHFLVGQAFFDVLGIEAPLVTDGILLPWEVEGTRGTIFILAHGRTEAFDLEDCRVMQVFAEFAAMGVRHQRQQKVLLEQARLAAAAAMANDLAHSINNPLQGLMNLLYLAAEGFKGEGSAALGEKALAELERLSSIVRVLLALPGGKVAMQWTQEVVPVASAQVLTTV
jgi:signal transduction histidine kinase